MLANPNDFPADYVTKELAAKITNELFDKKVQELGICTHPAQKIVATCLAWRLNDCDFVCECGIKIEIMKWKPRTSSIKTPELGFISNPSHEQK